MEDLFFLGLTWLLCGRLSYFLYIGGQTPPKDEAAYDYDYEERAARRQQRNEMWGFTLAGIPAFLFMLLIEGVNSKLYGKGQ